MKSTYPRVNKARRRSATRAAPADCTLRREFDERVCIVCSLRWSIDQAALPAPAPWHDPEGALATVSGEALPPARTMLGDDARYARAQLLAAKARLGHDERLDPSTVRYVMGLGAEAIDRLLGELGQ